MKKRKEIARRQPRERDKPIMLRNFLKMLANVTIINLLSSTLRATYTLKYIKLSCFINFIIFERTSIQFLSNFSHSNDF